jgi:carbamoyltransferase
MTVILGFNAFHADSAACLVVDGKLRGAVAEERLGERHKHSSTFPANAIRRLLADTGLRLRDVTHVAMARDPRANYAAKMTYVASHPVRATEAVFEHMRRNRQTKSTLEQLAEVCDEDPASATFETVGVEHHLAHIASAYFLSPFDELTAGFSYDASGDFASMMAARCEGNRIEVLDRVTIPDSLGFFYTALCQFIGFDEFGEEYKVMGLAAYGEDRYAGVMRKLVRLDDDHWYRLGKGFFRMHEGGESGAVDNENHVVMGRLFSDRLCGLLGKSRGRSDSLTQREKDIARSTQVRFEQASEHCIRKLHRLVPTHRLAMAGGCALNGVANARIHRDTPFTAHYLQAAASDDGTCLGAAYYCWHKVLDQKERFYMEHAFWGPEYPDERLRAVAESSGLAVQQCADNSQLVEVAAELIAGGLVMGWYQGRSEWGPRALGNRSILANPTITTMKETINAKIKRRESFRPFAPSVLKEYVPTYFEQTIDSPFMMHVVKIRTEWRERLPAVTHIDGTGRLQTVDRQGNPLYYSLIDAFRRKTGVGMVLNTSFNENEPIVDTPEQALACFQRTDMDALCLGRYVIVKVRSY